MTKDEKKVIFIGVGIVLAVLLIMVIVKVASDSNTSKNEELNKNIASTQTKENTEKYTANLEEGAKINTSTEFNKSKKYKELEISNIQFTYKDGKSVLLADVKNTANTKHESEIIKMTIIDENGKVIDELKPILPTIEAGATKQLNVMITGKDSVNAKDFKIEESK